jgi:hypothetical protein
LSGVNYSHRLLRIKSPLKVTIFLAVDRGYFPLSVPAPPKPSMCLIADLRHDAKLLAVTVNIVLAQAGLPIEEKLYNPLCTPCLCGGIKYFFKKVRSPNHLNSKGIMFQELC